MSTVPQRTRSQRHAEAALAKIKALLAPNASAIERKEYKTRADNFPVMVMQAGLAQAVGFMRAKAGEHVSNGAISKAVEEAAGRPVDDNEAAADASPSATRKSADADADAGKAARKAAYRRYLDDLAIVVGLADGEALLERAIKDTLPDYRRLTREALAAASWLKRFGQAYLSGSGGEQGSADASAGDVVGQANLSESGGQP